MTDERDETIAELMAHIKLLELSLEAEVRQCSEWHDLYLRAVTDDNAQTVKQQNLEALEEFAKSTIHMALNSQTLMSKNILQIAIDARLVNQDPARSEDSYQFTDIFSSHRTLNSPVEKNENKKENHKIYYEDRREDVLAGIKIEFI